MLRALEDDGSPEPQNHAAYRYVLPLAEQLPDGDRVMSLLPGHAQP
jgi:hypothetical protein